MGTRVCHVVIVALVLGAAGVLPAQEPQAQVAGAGADVFAPSPGGGRTSTLLADGWSFLASDAAVPALLPAAAEWQEVRLPHSWNSTDATDLEPGYRRGGGWYRRSLDVADTAGVRYVLHFEAANTRADVFVNGARAGGHVGGYVGFDVDVTAQLRPRTSNLIEVRVDNSYDPQLIPSQKSDFVIFGGLTRAVSLRVLPAGHIAALRVRTPAVSRTAARAVVEVELAGPRPAGSVVELTLTSPEGRVVARGRAPVSGASDVVSLTLPVTRPSLWSPASPALYTVAASLRAGGQELDELADRIGFRWYEFPPGGPFLLNGERLPLRGTHWHEDYAGYGAAMPDSLRRLDLERIKDMGANFVRLAHYPHDPAVYRAADELGLLLWDELPWCRGGVGDSLWQANTRRLLAEQIRQNYNHPSIILWSLGNEVDWLPDFAGGGEPAAVDAFLGELNRLAHRLDPTRLTALRKYPGAVPIVDVFSPSIWSGWYNGVYRDYQQALEATRRLAPRFVHMEYGGDSHVGRHTETPITGEGLVSPGGWEEAPVQAQVRNIAQQGDWSESYITDLVDWYLTTAEGLDWLTGNAQWAFKDFPTPLRPENPIPYVNQKGLLDRAGEPKDAYWVFRSHWSEWPRFAHIESHTWTERYGPAGQPRQVRVRSNCPAVELLLNGETQGVRTRRPAEFPAQGLGWDVVFRAGENRLEARCEAEARSAAAGAMVSPRPPVQRGYGGGPRVAVADTLVVTYTTTRFGPADHVRLTSKPLPGGRLLIEAVAVDAAGRRVLDYERRIYFSHDGAGRLLADEGTPTRSRVIEMANGRAAIEFVPEPGGRAVIEARNQDFKGDYLVIGGAAGVLLGNTQR